MRINDDFSTHSKLSDLGRWHITRFVEGVARGLEPGLRLLDAGAGECVYKPLFQHCRYVAVDLAVGDLTWHYANVDVVGRLNRLPLRDGSVDAILCTQALEHLEWPRESVAEFHRVLRPGGRLFMTVPMAHPEHQIPHDYFRYTSYGLGSILRGAGFAGFEIEPMGGLLMRLGYELPRVMSLFPGSGIFSGSFSLWGVLAFPLRALTFCLIRLFQVIFIWADRFDRRKDDPFGWAVTARR